MNKKIEKPSLAAGGRGSKLSEEKLVVGLYESFMSSLESQIDRNEKAAVLLGGFDSGLVAAGLARLGKDVHTYTFRFDDERYDQNYTDLLQEHVGSSHHRVDCSPDMYAIGLEQYGRVFNAPTNWMPYVIFTRLAGQLIRKHGFSHVHSGDGADVVFWGHPLAFERANIIENFSKLPAIVLDALAFTMNFPVAERLIGRPWHVIRTAIDQAQFDESKRGILPFEVVHPSAISWLFGEKPGDDLDIQRLTTDLASSQGSASPGKKAFFSKSVVSPSKIKINALSSNLNLSMSSPYFSPILRSAVEIIPENLLRSGSDSATKDIGKYLLAKMAEKYELLPRNFIYQNKMAASDTPAHYYLKDPVVWKQAMLNMESLPFSPKSWVVDRTKRLTAAERVFARKFSKKTNNVMTVDHLSNLLISYGSYYRD